MNWPTRTYILLLLSFLTFTACENPDVALDLEGETRLETSFTDTVTIKAATVLLNDSILGFKRGNLLTGQARDAANNFGTVKATTFTEVALGSGSFTDAANAVIDSMVLSLDYDEYYGDTTQNLTVRVHRLQEAFREDQIYFADRGIPYQEAVLGSRTFKPRPKQTVKSFNADSSAIVRQPIPLKIRLDNALANQILAQRETILASQEAFVNFLPGLALTSNENAKAILGFNPASDSTYLRIYYRAGDKRYRYNFFLNQNNNRLNQVTANRANTPLAGLQQAGDAIASTATNNRIFLQESTGLKGKITFPYITTLKEKLNGAFINRAELVFPVVGNTSDVSPYLYLYETNNSNKILRYKTTPRSLSGDGAHYPAGYSSPAAAVYSAKEKAYILNVTSYVQALIYDIRPKEKTSTGSKELSPSQGLIVSPASLTTQSLVSLNDLLGLQTLRQTVISTSPGNQIKLRLYYSAKQ